MNSYFEKDSPFERQAHLHPVEPEEPIKAVSGFARVQAQEIDKEAAKREARNDDARALIDDVRDALRRGNINAAQGFLDDLEFLLR